MPETSPSYNPLANSALCGARTTTRRPRVIDKIGIEIHCITSVIHIGTCSNTSIRAVRRRCTPRSQPVSGWRTAAPLPSVRDLAARLRVNPATIAQAYRELEAEGFVEIRHGAGTYVRELAPGRRTRERARQAKTLVERLLADARRIGVSLDELREAIDGALGAKTT